MARALDSRGLGEAAFLAAMVGEDGDSVLQLAATHGRVDLLRYLVEDLGLDINQPSSIGLLPFAPIIHLGGFNSSVWTTT
jgi:hypothetical protein